MLTLDDIELLFARHGSAQYSGEPVTQLEHALQTAHLAEQAGADDALVTAALLHDLGHLLNDQGETPTLRGIDDMHQYFALPFLRGLFADAVLDADPPARRCQALPVRHAAGLLRARCRTTPSAASRCRAAFTPAQAAPSSRSRRGDAVLLRAVGRPRQGGRPGDAAPRPLPAPRAATLRADAGAHDAGRSSLGACCAARCCTPAGTRWSSPAATRPLDTALHPCPGGADGAAAAALGRPAAAARLAVHRGLGGDPLRLLHRARRRLPARRPRAHLSASCAASRRCWSRSAARRSSARCPSPIAWARHPGHHAPACALVGLAPPAARRCTTARRSASRSPTPRSSPPTRSSTALGVRAAGQRAALRAALFVLDGMPFPRWRLAAPRPRPAARRRALVRARWPLALARRRAPRWARTASRCGR